MVKKKKENGETKKERKGSRQNVKKVSIMSTGTSTSMMSRSSSVKSSKWV